MAKKRPMYLDSERAEDVILAYINGVKQLGGSVHVRPNKSTPAINLGSSYGTLWMNVTEPLELTFVPAIGRGTGDALKIMKTLKPYEKR